MLDWSALLAPSPRLADLPPVPGAEPSRCFHDALRVVIAQRISQVLAVSIEQAYDAVDDGVKGADYSLAIPRLKLQWKADWLAARVARQFEPDDWFESVTVAPPFLHFRARTATLTRGILDQVDELTHRTASGLPEYGTNDSGRGKKAVLQYGSVYMTHGFNPGHSRTTIIGSFLANLYRACGWDVVSLNYLRDWNTQYGLVAIGFERGYGNQEALEKDPIKHLFDIYVKIRRDADAETAIHDVARAFFKRMEDGDKQALENWRVWRELSIKQYSQEYAQLNVPFDEYTGESTVSRKSQDDAVQRLQKLKLTKMTYGELLVDLKKHELGTATLRKNDGTVPYLTRALAGAIERWEKYHFDKMLYVVSSRDRRLAQIFKLLALMGYKWAARLEHVSCGAVHGMSARTTDIVVLHALIHAVAAKVVGMMRQSAKKYQAVTDPERTSVELGISAIKIQELQAPCAGNYIFDWAHVASFTGDTGPYLQYTHIWLASLERKNAELLPLPPRAEIDTGLLVEPEARKVVFLLGTYPAVVRTAMRTHDSTAVVAFAMKLSRSINSALDVLEVKYETDRDKARARLWMFVCARDVLGAAMRLLTLRPLEQL
ncbi:Nucleotidylyl transferase [Auricularia subglabra TFB-10046 SS5]|nr:Nucleotidylyl transferase [Auricularia subglabra TFB-10046 SS5]